MPAVAALNVYVHAEESGSKHGGPTDDAHPLCSSCTPSAKPIMVRTDAEWFLDVYDTAGMVMVPSLPVATGGGGGIGLVDRASSASILLTIGGTAACKHNVA